MVGFASLAAALSQWSTPLLGLVSTIVAFNRFVIVGGGYVTPYSVGFFRWALLVGLPITYLALDEAMPPETVQAAISITCAFLALMLLLPGARPDRSRWTF